MYRNPLSSILNPPANNAARVESRSLRLIPRSISGVIRAAIGFTADPCRDTAKHPTTPGEITMGYTDEQRNLMGLKDPSNDMAQNSLFVFASLRCVPPVFA